MQKYCAGHRWRIKGTLLRHRAPERPGWSLIKERNGRSDVQSWDAQRCFDYGMFWCFDVRDVWTLSMLWQQWCFGSPLGCPTGRNGRSGAPSLDSQIFFYEGIFWRQGCFEVADVLTSEMFWRQACFNVREVATFPMFSLQMVQMLCFFCG